MDTTEQDYVIADAAGSIEQCVREFHYKHGHKAQRLKTAPSCIDDFVCNSELENASRQLILMSDTFLKAFRVGIARGELSRDNRLLRAHLHLEEVGELLQALADRDEVAVLDACCDEVYVSVGTAVSLDLPFSRAMVEVCKSNSTKSQTHSTAPDERLRDKGPAYKPPAIKQVIDEHRIKRTKQYNRLKRQLAAFDGANVNE